MEDGCDGRGKRPLADLGKEADGLAGELARGDSPQPGRCAAARLRRDYLRAQVHAVSARIRMLQGARLDFDAESRELYDAVAPTYDEATFRAGAREARGAGSWAGRSGRSRRGASSAGGDSARQARCRLQGGDRRVPRTHRRASGAARRRGVQAGIRHRQAVERLQLVSGQVPQPDPDQHRAADLHRSRGRSRLSRRLSRAITSTTCCSRSIWSTDRGWREFTVYPLFSPQSLIAEGTANFGIDVAFPGAERVRFERDRLYPLAGLDQSLAEKYHEVLQALDELSYAGNEAARQYLNGKMSKDEAATWLVKYTADVPSARRAARALLRRLSQLRDQLQLRQGPGASVRRGRRRHDESAGCALEGVRRSDFVAAPAVGSRGRPGQ